MNPNLALLMLGAVGLTLFAQFKVKRTFNKFSKVASNLGYTGAQAAEIILRDQGITNVRVKSTPGMLTDNYNPRHKTVNLSQSVHSSTSLAAVAVAAHEVGHAIQDDEGYAFLRFRHALVPLVNFTSNFVWILITIGFIIQAAGLVDIGILFFSLTVLFQIVTLPVELNASSRALKLLQSNGIVEEAEVKGSRKVLYAAALTYIASMIYSVINLMRLLSMRDND